MQHDPQISRFNPKLLYIFPLNSTLLFLLKQIGDETSLITHSYILRAPGASSLFSLAFSGSHVPVVGGRGHMPRCVKLDKVCVSIGDVEIDIFFALRN